MEARETERIVTVERNPGTAPPSVDPESSQLLLAEFSERSQNRRHYESQIEHILDLYVGVCTVLVAGMAFLINAETPVLPRMWVVAIVLVALATVGVFLAGRTIAADIRVAEQTRALNSLRRYYVGRNQSIAECVSPRATVKSVGQTKCKLRTGHFMLIEVLRWWSSLLFGIGCAVLVNKFVARLWSDAAGLAIGIAVGLAVTVNISCVCLPLVFRGWRKKIIDMVKTE